VGCKEGKRKKGSEEYVEDRVFPSRTRLRENTEKSRKDGRQKSYFSGGRSGTMKRGLGGPEEISKKRKTCLDRKEKGHV